jgi:hypothetical protein
LDGNGSVTARLMIIARWTECSATAADRLVVYAEPKAGRPKDAAAGTLVRPRHHHHYHDKQFCDHKPRPPPVYGSQSGGENYDIALPRITRGAKMIVVLTMPWHKARLGWNNTRRLSRVAFTGRLEET